MAEQKKQSEYKWLVRILFLLVIIIAALFVFIWTGTMRCRSIPGGCNIYWSVMTLVTGKQQPSVLILYDPTDQKGLGNPELLKDLLTDRKGVAIHPTLADIRYLNSEQLKNVSLVIVEKSRKISTLQLMTMLNYISQGGRLVWIGDAGVEADTDRGDMLYVGPENDRNNGWVRLTDTNRVIFFNRALGVNFVTNFCDVRDCHVGDKYTGKLMPSSDTHPLVYGLKSNLPIYDNYSIVTLIEPNPVPLKIDFGSNLRDTKNRAYGDIFDAIVTSNSNRVAYYAIPPEYLAEERDGDNKYYSIVYNMFEGMVN
ncbi:MAG TPA: hypothetical protein PK655_00465 [archaeon]|jgi:hypothetical protein|nr:hypothetical protein [archaeon]HPV65914.1 hypothetical protein [archaeon]HRS42451.1 hypothetical protein [Candidatus Diapherotrites archaeon]